MDPEQIVGLLPGTKRKLLPLAGNFKYVQASLQLEHLRLVIVQRPPCASEDISNRIKPASRSRWQIRLD